MASNAVDVEASTTVDENKVVGLSTAAGRLREPASAEDDAAVMVAGEAGWVAIVLDG